MAAPRWHKRSDDDGDTHYGLLESDGWVKARCRVVFRPMEDLFTPGASLRTEIAKRCCSVCADPPGSWRGEDAERVRDVMSALGSGQRAKRKPRRARRS